MTNDELSAVLDGLVPRGYIHDGRDQQMFGLGVEWSAAEVRRHCAELVAAVRDTRWIFW